MARAKAEWLLPFKRNSACPSNSWDLANRQMTCSPSIRSNSPWLYLRNKRRMDPVPSDYQGASRRILFCFFFISGFCSLVYQIIWTRLAFASFGIITPVLSVVISVFMMGLAIGSWAAGRFVGPLVKKVGRSTVFAYALAEGVIGIGALAVPQLFGLGARSLLLAGQSNSLSYL